MKTILTITACLALQYFYKPAPASIPTFQPGTLAGKIQANVNTVTEIKNNLK